MIDLLSIYYGFSNPQDNANPRIHGASSCDLAGLRAFLLLFLCRIHDLLSNCGCRGGLRRVRGLLWNLEWGSLRICLRGVG